MKLIEIYINPDPPLEEMANLFKDDTGIDYPLWIGKIGGHHGPRIKVSNIKGKMRMNDNFVISVSSDPKVLTPETCRLSNNDVQLILNWVKMNFDDLMTLWWMFEHQALVVKDEDTGQLIQYDDVLDNLKKV